VIPGEKQQASKLRSSWAGWRKTQNLAISKKKSRPLTPDKVAIADTKLKGRSAKNTV